MHKVDEPLLAREGHSASESWFTRWRLKLIIGGIIMLFIVLIVVISVSLALRSGKGSPPYNVIFMVGDGFGPSEITLARACSGKSQLNFDTIQVGTVKTFSTSSLVTDSAAAATAYSCGVKTYNGAIGVGPDYKPCGTLLEAAKSKGMMTGLVVTDAVPGATPGAFSSHAIDRNMFEFIAKQQVDLKVDVIFGGGLVYFNNRKDNLNLTEYAFQKGYQVVTNLEDFRKPLNPPVLALFANDRMSFEIDRDPNVQPSLAEMTQTALNILSQSPNGFFALVEGSNIDVAGHQNDPVANFRDALAYDNALEVILQFSNQNGRTLVVATSDHETGGLALGVDGVYAYNPNVLQRVNASSFMMASLIQSGQDISNVLSQYAGLNLTPQELQSIQNVSTNVATTTVVIGHIISKRAGLSWSTTGHSGVDVNLYATGYQSNQLRGNYDNQYLAKWIAQIFSLDLEAETIKLQNFNPNGTLNAASAHHLRVN